MATERLEQLLEAVGDARSALILPHNDPDPDAIASAVALRHLFAEKLGLQGHIAYRGIIGRAENKALVRYLGRPLRRLKGSDLRESVPIALVDTQPGAGNNALPPASSATIVLDHHPLQDATSRAIFADVRPELGSTSTMMTKYIQAARIELSPMLATVLFYGIKADTMGLIRGASSDDVAAYFFLQPHIEVDALLEIERAQLSAEYFKRLHTALESALVHDGVVVSFVGAMNRPDLAAEMADLFMRLQGSRWVICMGVYRGELILAVRTRNRRGGAGQLARDIVGSQGTAGGHGIMAGGQIHLGTRQPERLAQELAQRALEYLKVPLRGVGKPLIE